MYQSEGHRILCLRNHRLLGLYLSLWAWVHRVDCVAIKSDDLRFFLDVNLIRKERLKWIQKDTSIYFRHSVNLYSGETHATIYLSRKALPDQIFQESMKDEDRIKLLKTKKLRAAVVKLPSEKEMFCMINKFVAGLEIPVIDKKAYVTKN